MRSCLALATIGLSGCFGVGSPFPCVEGTPGIEVTVTVPCAADGPPGQCNLSWQTGGGRLSLTVGTAFDSVVLLREDFDERGQAIARMKYPRGAADGPADLRFHADGGAQIVFTGEVSFVANVDGCRRLELEVTTTDGLPMPASSTRRRERSGAQGRDFRAGRLGRWRRPIQARAPMCLATSSTGGLRAPVHHLPTKVTIPTRAWA
jgi:hypothetical protein